MPKTLLPTPKGKSGPCGFPEKKPVRLEGKGSPESWGVTGQLALFPELSPCQRLEPELLRSHILGLAGKP